MTVTISTPSTGDLASNAITLLSRATNVDMNTGTEQPLYYAPAGQSVIITHVVPRNPSTSLTTVSWSIGWNSGSSNDVIANATHTELTGSTLYTPIPAKNGAKVGVGNNQDVLRLKCNTNQGSAATCDFDIFGYTI